MNKPVIVAEELVAPVVVEPRPQQAAAAPAYVVLGGLSFSHFLNDTMQSLVPSLYPVLKTAYALDYGQIGLITMAFQFTSSLLQPVVGTVTDRKPMPYSLSIGMGFTLAGLILLSMANNYTLILLSASLVGIGSAVFHPEASRIARMASGGRFGFAQSVFQVGGNFGSAMGPLLAALIVVPFGQPSVAWFSLFAFAAMVILWRVGQWYAPRIVPRTKKVVAHQDALPQGRVVLAIAVLVVLLISKSLYMVSLTSYYALYLVHKFGISAQVSQIYLFVFLGAVAVGVFFGGPLSDRFGRRAVIWFSILGALPFTLALPYAGLFGGAVLTVLIGLILSSAMSIIIVFAQELMPHRVGMISGLFFGLSFGVGGIGAAALGQFADMYSIDFVYQICSFLPALGLLAVFLPRAPRRKTDIAKS